MRTARALWGMARPLIMGSVVLVYVSGLLIGWAQGYALDAGAIFWAFSALLLVSLSIHYTNEYADYETDALTTPTLYSGGSGVLARGEVPRRLALQAAWVTLSAGLALGGAGLGAGILRPPLFALLLGGAFFGWMYSLPPLRLAWRGYGEADNAILGGLFLHLYGHATLSTRLDIGVALACLPFTLLCFNNLLATTWADREADAAVGKRTLATRFSPPALRRLYTIVLMSALSLSALVCPPPVALGGLVASPFLGWGYATYARQHVPYPTSNAMLVFLLGQMAGWLWLGYNRA